MRETVTYVTQSKFFSPAFNAAIFDGPIRIYFAQYQESQALKIYFSLQERFQDIRKDSRGIFKDRARNIFVMLYPTNETFDLSFKNDEAPVLTNGAGAWAGPTVIRTRLGQDFVVGVRGPLEEGDLEDLYSEMESIVKASEV
jgi:hypothetical protein